MQIRKTALFALCASALCSAAPVRPAHADGPTAYAKVLGMYAGLALLGYRGGMRNQDVDVIGPGRYVSYDVVLYRGTRYAFFAAGDQNIADLDILVYDANGTLLAWDEDATELAQTFLVPAYSGAYRFYVRNYRGDVGYFAMAITTD